MSAYSPHSAVRPDAFSHAVVLGAGGFLGHRVTLRLLATGTRVLGIATKPWAGAMPEGYAHSTDGTGAFAQAARFLQGAKGPAGFFHLAGLADAHACQRDPELARRLNVDLVAQALAALAGVPCAFVFPSTGIVYGDALPRSAREDDPLSPGAEYARGKIKAEGLIRAACASGPGQGAIARLSNLYGPGGSENTVLGRVLAQARRGGPLQVWDESPVRDFLYVEDAAEGLLRLGLAALASGTFTANLSTGVGTRIGELIDLCAELFHTSRLPQEREPDPAARVSRLVLDNGLLEVRTRWRPPTSLGQGLECCFRNAARQTGTP